MDLTMPRRARQARHPLCLAPMMIFPAKMKMMLALVLTSGGRSGLSGGRAGSGLVHAAEGQSAPCACSRASDDDPAPCVPLTKELYYRSDRAGQGISPNVTWCVPACPRAACVRCAHGVRGRACGWSRIGA